MLFHIINIIIVVVKAHYHRQHLLGRSLAVCPKENKKDLACGFTMIVRLLAKLLAVFGLPEQNLLTAEFIGKVDLMRIDLGDSGLCYPAGILTEEPTSL